MTSDDFGYDERTLPPLDPGAGLVCPRCHERPDVVSTLPPRAVMRCPKHGLAYVDARELVESGGDSLLGSTVAGRFVVLSRLGAGSMGAVYRARQEAVGRDVALKIVRAERAYDPETKGRFEREARATSALVSPHTITVFDFGASEDGSWFLAMELLEGETLGERLRREGRLPIVDATRFAIEAATSLAEAHGKGIIHRDLKPDNLFITKVPRPSGGQVESVKVLDFGIAKLVRGDDAPVDQLETQAGTVFGTPRYMSPEQAQGSALDARTDLYSLGVILYHMLAGRAPFVDDDAVVVMARHIKDAPPPFAEVAPDLVIPAPVERVVLRALSKRQQDRPATAEQLASELEAALLESSVVATGTFSTWAAPPAARPRPSRALYLGLGGLVLVALVLVGFLVTRAAVRQPVATASPGPSLGVEAASARAPDSSAGVSAGPSASATAIDLDTEGDASVPRGPATKPVIRARPAIRAVPTKPDSPYGRFE